MRPRQALVLVAVQLAAAGMATGALRAQAPAAASPDHLSDRWQFLAAGSLFRAATTLRIDASDGSPGTEVSTDDIGAAKTGFQPRVGLRWRPGRRHEIEFAYQYVRRGGERVLSDTIVFRDTSYAAGLRVQSDVRTDVGSLIYRFNFRMRERSRYGVAVGLGVLNFGSTINAVAGATQGGPDTAIVRYGRTGSTLAPTFAVGLFGRWRTGDRWYVEADARALYVPVDRVTVGVVEGGGLVRYFVSNTVGLEAGYALNAVGLRLDPRSDGGGLAGKISLGIQTLRLGLLVAL